MGTVVSWQQGIEENGRLKAFLPHNQMSLGLCVDDKWSSSGATNFEHMLKIK